MSTGILIILIGGASSLVEKLTQTITPDRRKKWFKRITLWGYINIFLFACGVAVSIYDYQKSQAENEKLQDLNRFLSLAHFNAPPKVSVKLNFRRNIPFDLAQSIEEREAIIRGFRNEKRQHPKGSRLVASDSFEDFYSLEDSVFAIQMDKLRKYYIDSAFLSHLCQSCFKNAISSRIEFAIRAGQVFTFYIPFSKYLAIPMVTSDTLGSMTSIERIFGSSNGIEADRVIYNENSIRIDFTLDRPINIGSVYQSTVDDIGESISAFMVHFNNSPEELVVNHINASINAIDSIDITISLDELDVRMFRIRFTMADRFAIIADKGTHEGQYVLIRQIDYAGKPEIVER